MRRFEVDDLPRHERYTRAEARARLGWRRGERRERACYALMRRFLRGYAGRSWSEAAAALGRFCAGRHEDAHLIRRARERVERDLGVRTSFRFGGSGIYTSEGRLTVDDETGSLVLNRFHRRELRTYDAAEVRPEPVVIARGKRTRR
jgi:hypothetical protein